MIVISNWNRWSRLDREKAKQRQREEWAWEDEVNARTSDV